LILSPPSLSPSPDGYGGLKKATDDQAIGNRKRIETAGKGNFKGSVWRIRKSFCVIIENKRNFYGFA